MAAARPLVEEQQRRYPRLAGGLVLRSETFRGLFLGGLRDCGVNPGPVGLVEDPAVGAVVLARKLL